MLDQPHVADDLGLEQAHRVAGDAVAESRVEFLRHRRAADDTSPLDHANLEARLGEIEGADEAVMPGADDDRVVCFRHSLPRHPAKAGIHRSEEHTSELQSLMRISYAVFCLKKKIK